MLKALVGYWFRFVQSSAFRLPISHKLKLELLEL